MTLQKNKLRSSFASFSIFIILIHLVTGCVTTNYYTARTLDQGQTVITPGLDNLIIATKDEGLLKKNVSFTPSFGLATGLGYRLETGFRYFFPYLLEANLRYQINPASFHWFDVSANLHSGVVFADKFRDISKPYWKYGFTFSKQIKKIEPYFSFYFVKNFMVVKEDDEPVDYQTFTFGVAMPVFNGDQILPEINFLKNEFGGKNYFTFGIGFRALLNKNLK